MDRLLGQKAVWTKHGLVSQVGCTAPAVQHARRHGGLKRACNCWGAVAAPTIDVSRNLDPTVSWSITMCGPRQALGHWAGKNSIQTLAQMQPEPRSEGRQLGQAPCPAVR